MTCPACGSPLTRPLVHEAAFPILVFPVPPHVAQSVPLEALVVRQCMTCGHAFQPAPLEGISNAIYDRYYDYYPFGQAEHFQLTYREPFNELAVRLLKEFGPARALEIGCNDIEQLRFMTDEGVDAWGVSPDAPLGHDRLIRSRSQDWSWVHPFDIILSRFSLEHMLDLEESLQHWKSLLSPEGVLLVQVPNTELLRDSESEFIYAHEHVHYFTRDSLMAALQANGFEILERFVHVGPSLIVASQLPAHRREPRNSGQYPFRDGYSNLLRDGRRQSRGEVFLYGAGLGLAGLLYGAGGGEPWAGARLVDDNPALHGLVMPHSSLLVESPNVLRDADAPLVILTLNIRYAERVVERVRDLNSHATVIGLSGREYLRSFQTG